MVKVRVVCAFPGCERPLVANNFNPHFKSAHLGENEAFTKRHRSQFMQVTNGASSGQIPRASCGSGGVLGRTGDGEASDADSDSDPELAAILTELNRGLRRAFKQKNATTFRTRAKRENLLGASGGPSATPPNGSILPAPVNMGEATGLSGTPAPSDGPRSSALAIASATTAATAVIQTHQHASTAGQKSPAPARPEPLPAQQRAVDIYAMECGAVRWNPPLAVQMELSPDERCGDTRGAKERRVDQQKAKGGGARCDHADEEIGGEASSRSEVATTFKLKSAGTACSVSPEALLWHSTCVIRPLLEATRSKEERKPCVFVCESARAIACSSRRG